MKDKSNPDFAVAVEQLTERVLNGEVAEIEKIMQRYPQFAPELKGMLSTLSALAHWKDEKPHTIIPDDVGFSTLPTDRRLGDFRIVSELGRGGMGVVYEAEQISLRRRVALKVLPFASLISEKQLRRFKNEALAAASLKHPNIVDVYGTGFERSVHFYAMQLVHGCDLSRVIRKIYLEDDRDEAQDAITTMAVAHLSTQRDASRRDFYRSVAKLGALVADALHFAHEEGVVHRDVKPANLLLDNAGKIHIADFGLARMRVDEQITLTGDLIGTLRYMSPEQVEGHPVDHRTDIYSLGATLYETLTGKSLFHDEQNRAQLMTMIVQANPIPLHQHGETIPADLCTIIHKCLKYAPDQRYATAKELAEDLQRFSDSRPIRAKRSSVFSSALSWARRNRKLAFLSSITISAIALLAIVGPVVAIRLERALDNERQLHAQLAIAHENSEMQLYDTRIRNALEGIKQGEYSTAQSVIDRYDSVSGNDSADSRSFEYWLLKSKLDDFQGGLVGKSGVDIRRIAVSPDGKRVAYGNWVGGIDMVDTKTSRVDHIGKLGAGPEKAITHVCEFSPDGKLLLVAGGTDQRVWDVERKKWIHLKHPGDESRNWSIIGGGFLDLSGQLGMLIVDQEQEYDLNVVSDAAFSVYSFDLKSDEPQLELVSRQITGPINGFSRSKAMAYATYESPNFKEIYRWTLPNLEPVDPIRLKRGNIDRLAAHPTRDDVLAVAYSLDNPDRRETEIELIATETGASIRFLATHSQKLGSLKFSPDGTILAAGFGDGHTWLWRDVKTQADQISFQLDRKQIHASTVQDVAFTSDMGALYTASSDLTARRTDLTDSLLPDVIPALGYTAAIRWTLNDQQLITGGKGGLSLWDVESKSRLLHCPLTVPVHEVNYVGDVCLLPDGVGVAFTANAWPRGDRSQIGIWNLLTNETFPILDATRQANRVGLSSDGKLLVAAVGDQMLAFSLDSLECVRKQTFSPRASIGLHPDRNLVAVSGLADLPDLVREVAIWDLDRWVQVAAIPTPEARGVGCITFSPDGRQLVADIGGGRIALWDDWQSDDAPRVLIGQGDVGEFAFTPDGYRLASAGWDGTVRIWNCNTGNELFSARTSAEWTVAMAFNGDGSALAFGGGVGTKYGSVHFLHAPQNRSAK